MACYSDNESVEVNPERNECLDRRPKGAWRARLLGLLLAFLLSSSILFCAFDEPLESCESDAPAHAIEMMAMVCMMLGVIAGGLTLLVAVRFVFKSLAQMFCCVSRPRCRRFLYGLSPPLCRRAAFAIPLRI